MMMIKYFLLFAPLAAAVCYYPNGYSEPSLAYQPCVSYNGVTSMCCGTNRTNPSGGSRSNGDTADICLQNGLCENVWRTTDENGTAVENRAYFRDQCTSTNWNNGGCLDICTSSVDNSTNSGFSVVTSCDGTANSTTWCCGSTNSCCGTPSAITIAAVLNAPTTTSSATSSPTSRTASTSSTSSPTSSATSSPSSSPSSTPSASSELSGGAKAGLGIGIAVAAVAVIALAFFLLRRRSMAKQPQTRTIETDWRPAQPPASNHPYAKAPQEVGQGGVYEADHEKPANTEIPRYELPSEPTRAMGV